MISITEIRADDPKCIFYSIRTCWWTHRPGDLGRLRETNIPCDPAGGVLLQTDDIDGFFKSARDKPDHYGRHRLRAFMAAHHSTGVGPFIGWDAYNNALDSFEPGGERVNYEDR